MTFRPRVFIFALLALFVSTTAFAGAPATSTRVTKSSSVTNATRVKKHTARRRHHRRATAARTTPAVMRTTTKARVRTASVRVRRPRRRRYIERFTASSYADGIGADDEIAGEDPIVRQAALEALGNMNGTVVAIDPSDGRILAMVNQKLALSSGAEPCSTIKIAVALAGLSEGVITPEEEIRLGRYSSMSLTEALAKSNNAYFEAVGRRLGFARYSRYAHEFGLGELAGYQIEGEQLGVFPKQELPAALGGVGRMCSFGEGISMTPLQLGALVSAIANGGTLYYLQHPESPEEAAAIQPRVKRQLNIADLIPEISVGMGGAVQYGTARSLRVNFTEEPILGKTGTCSKSGTRFGWFASYADTQYGRIATVVFLQGGRPTYGPKAAEITGRFYRALYDNKFFAQPATAASGSPDDKAVGVKQ